MSLASPTAKVRIPAEPAGKSTARQGAHPVPGKAAQGAQAVAAPGKPATTPVAKPVLAAPAPRPVRTSRLMQLTVPGMAQSVASTAAKSSYSQLPAQVVTAPPVYVATPKDPKLANNWKRKALEDLTEADVLAMPDSEYMNQVQMSYFKRVLVKLRADMLSNAGETTEHLREDTVIVPDPADRATIEEEHALELRTRDRERKLLKKVEQSINRIDSGDYGYCDETGEPIGVGRLLARPTANLSLEAQQRRELKQKMFGD
jgi:DnaK suppressor protein